MESESLNDGDNALGIDLEDSHCPDCGREVNRRMFSYRAYCPWCDDWYGRQAIRIVRAYRAAKNQFSQK